MSKFSPENIAKEIVEAILKPSANAEEMSNLRKIASGMSVDDWKTRQIALVTGSGALAGSMGGPWGMAAMVADLAWLGKNAGQGCLGVGYALGKSVNPDDIDLILAVWTKMGVPSNTVPSGAVAIAVSEDVSSWGQAASEASFAPVGKISAKLGVKSLAKVSGKLTGKIITKKLAVKGGSKLGAKLAVLAISMASSKLAAKLAAKLGTSWVPILGGLVSGGINFWLMSELLNAAESYYTYDYIILKNAEVAALA
ncbi:MULTISPECIES: hypothetical protein [unclassified Microcoleus]|uniref:hypothetical protein n=1 Tax=unclassified Microcoleus TaxID=2642155 RepID=UPI002FD6259E